MKNKHIRLFMLCSILIAFNLIGCSGLSQTVIPPRATIDNSTVQEPVSLATPNYPSSTMTVLSTASPTLTLTRSPTLQPTASFKCSSVSLIPLMGKGERLLFLDRSENESRFIAVDDYSGKTDVIFTINTHILVSRFSLSMDGTQIVYLVANEDRVELGVYNLKNGDNARFPLPNNTDILALNGWTEDGRTIVTTKWEYEYNLGISYTLFLVNPTSGETETKQGLYELPGINYDPDYPAFNSNIPSIDPLEERALYFKQVGPGTPKAVLIDLVSNKILWENDKGYNGVPDWDVDGSRAVFASFYGGDPYLKIISLSKDGVVSELTHQRLFDFEYDFRYFDLSPDSRYVHYAFWHTVGDGPGYVLDTSNGQIWKICVSDGNFTYGNWLNQQNFLVYKTVEAEVSTYWVLDARKWQNRKITSGKNITFIGLTTLNVGQ